MTGCCAEDCSNSSAKGFTMKRFPKDPDMRNQWWINTGRGNWKPNDNSYLCEVHFAPEMWEKTCADGTRKLKKCAVPTIFSFRRSLVLQELLPPNEAQSLSTDTPTKPEDARVQPSTSASALVVGQLDESLSSGDNNAENISPLLGFENDPRILARLEKYESLYLKERAKAKKYKKLLRNARNKIERLEKEILTYF